MLRYTSIFGLALTVAACGSDTMMEEEVEEITTVTVSLTAAGETDVTAVWDDADGAGGAAPTVDSITLKDGVAYTATLMFTNKLEDPAEDITAEILEENDEHQIFFGGSVGTLLTHAYGDMDANGDPVGLTNTITATGAGTGTLTVLLRHLPPINEMAQKVSGLDDTFKASGAAGLPGETDVSISFDLTVQ